MDISRIFLMFVEFHTSVVVSARRHGQWPVSYEGGKEEEDEEEEEELCPSFVESEVLMSRVRKSHLGGRERRT